MIKGKTKFERKHSVAVLVKDHLSRQGLSAEIIKDRVNSLGHKDLVLVKCDIGLIHVSTCSSKDPNASLITSNFANNSQKFLADKDYVAFGWQTKDKRTLLIFLKASELIGKDSITKAEASRLKVNELSEVYSGT